MSTEFFRIPNRPLSVEEAKKAGYEMRQAHEKLERQYREKYAHVVLNENDELKNQPAFKHK